MTRFLKLAAILLFLGISAPAFATTHFIRSGGGTRYDATNAPSGQCDGLADADYPGTGVNQHCAFNEVPYLWDLGINGAFHQSWAISGGDEVVIRSCAGGCRLGWSAPTGGANIWCYAVGNNDCYNPTIPAGTSGAHTIFIGGYAYDHGGNASGGATQPHTYLANLTELFGGYDLFWAFNLQSTSYVDIVGIDLDVHNAVTAGNPGYPGNCTRGGAPAYPVSCQTGSQPYDDNARNGFLLNSSSTNITFTDVYAYGFSGSGFFGPIGAGISGTRVESSFNAGDAWQFDDGSDDPNGTAASWIFSYFTAIGNGCYGEYPVVHSFPARACYDTSSGGSGGDTLSGQDATIATLTATNFYAYANTKDNFIGPHTQIGNLTITNSYSYGNMGAAWKWGGAPNATVLFQNNLTVTNCLRQTEILPGAAQNFNISTGLGGSYLSNFCRGGGSGFANVMRSGSTLKFYGNSVIGLGTIGYQVACGYYTVGNVFNPETTCNTSTTSWIDNNLLGYTDQGAGSPTALFCLLNTDGSTCTLSSNSGIALTNSFNNEYGWRSGTTDTCTGNITCVPPLLVNQPAETFPGTQTDFDVFNPFVSNNSFYPTGSSPLIGAGTTLAGLTADYYGTTRPSPPTIGGVEPAGAPPSTPGVGFSGSVLIRGSVVIQ